MLDIAMRQDVDHVDETYNKVVTDIIAEDPVIKSILAADPTYKLIDKNVRTLITQPTSDKLDAEYNAYTERHAAIDSKYESIRAILRVPGIDTIKVLIANGILNDEATHIEKAMFRG